MPDDDYPQLHVESKDLDEFRKSLERIDSKLSSLEDYVAERSGSFARKMDKVRERQEDFDRRIGIVSRNQKQMRDTYDEARERYKHLREYAMETRRLANKSTTATGLAITALFFLLGFLIGLWL